MSSKARSKKGKKSRALDDFDDEFDDDLGGGGGGHHGRHHRLPPEDDFDDLPPVQPKKSKKKKLQLGEPETTIGEEVQMKGELTFARLLRIDGRFEGQLHSSGSLVIGAQGELKGDVDGMRAVQCYGVIRGNVQADIVELLGEGQIHGNVSARSLKVDAGTTLLGTLSVHENAPAKYGAPEPEAAAAAAPEEGSPADEEDAKDAKAEDKAPPAAPDADADADDPPAEGKAGADDDDDLDGEGEEGEGEGEKAAK